MRACVWIVLLLCGLLPLSSSAAEPVFKEGEHYQVVPKPEKFPAHDKIEVLEFFWYGCPHCYQFESDIAPWLAHKPEEVTFRRVPHNMGRSAGDMHELGYHIAENLGIVKRIHPEMFKAIHDHKQAMDSISDICSLFVKFGGVTDEQCHAAAEDEEVKHASDFDDFLIRRYGVVNVPTLVVDGRYLSNAVMAGGTSKLIQVLDFLIAKQKVERNIHMTLPDDEPLVTAPPKAPKALSRPPAPF